MSESREGCCADQPKPCSYHEGWQDAMDGAAPLTDVARLLQRVLGLHGDDWRVVPWPEKWEGWSASLETWCSVALADGSDAGFDQCCGCCDPLNLAPEDVALIEAALAALRGGSPLPETDGAGEA